MTTEADMVQSESDFLASYDRKAFELPLVTVDAVIFTFWLDDLYVLLTQRSSHPALGQWALPGGFLDEAKDTTLEDAVHRKLKEKTGIAAPYVEQLMAVGNNQRDARAWSVTVAYTALIAHQNCESHVDNVSDVKWLPYSQAVTRNLAFDHTSILKSARERLKQKALYSIVPGYALPEEFTLPELQRLHEVLIDKSLQKKSFRRRIEQAELLEEAGQRAPQGKGRPSVVYRLKESARAYTFTRNLES